MIYFQIWLNLLLIVSTFILVFYFCQICHHVSKLQLTSQLANFVKDWFSESCSTSLAQLKGPYTLLWQNECKTNLAQPKHLETRISPLEKVLSIYHDDKNPMNRKTVIDIFYRNSLSWIPSDLLDIFVAGHVLHFYNHDM